MLSKLNSLLRAAILEQNTSISGVNKSLTSINIPMTSGEESINLNEITYEKEISDTQIEREEFIERAPAQTYKVVSGDSLWKISQKFGVSLEAIYAANPGFSENTTLSIGQTINIPGSRKIVNVKSLSQVATAMGVSEEFIKQLKKAEDGMAMSEKEFHNTSYTDNAGVLTIGIGHSIQNDNDRKEIIERYGSLNLTDPQVCHLFASDLLEAEENIAAIIGQKNYDNAPQAMKEALLDMILNKGNAIIKDTPGLAYCLKSGKYEAAINLFTNIKSTKTQEEMAGLAKRRLLNISIAIKMYDGGEVPQSNINTAQYLYDKGVELLRKECEASDNLKFEDQIVGYNNDIKGYFGERIKLEYQYE